MIQDPFFFCFNIILQLKSDGHVSILASASFLRPSDFFQEWWTHGAINGSFSEITGQAYKTKYSLHLGSILDIDIYKCFYEMNIFY